MICPRTFTSQNTSLVRKISMILRGGNLMALNFVINCPLTKEPNHRPYDISLKYKV